MAEVKWIKIVIDIFDDEKILLIESLPEGDAILIIWFKLLCLAGKQNNSGVFMLNDKIPYTEEMLSTIFRRPLQLTRLALKTFENFGMIEIINNTVVIPNWKKHQSLDALEKKRIYNRNYMKKKREEQKALVASSIHSSTTGSPTSSPTVAESSRTDIDIDIDKDIKDIYSPAEAEPCIPYQEIVEHLNKVTNSNYRHTTKKTQSLIRARWQEGNRLDDYKKVIDTMWEEWGGTDMEKYLRPETLFSPKFESYLNRKPKKRTSTRSSNIPNRLEGFYE